MKVQKCKPLMEMTPQEFDMAMDSAGRNIDRRILDAVRRGEDQDVVLAVAILTLPDGTRRIAVTGCEYGDGEGIRFAKGFVAGVKRTHLLHKGERIHVETWRMERSNRDGGAR